MDGPITRKGDATRQQPPVVHGAMAKDDVPASFRSGVRPADYSAARAYSDSLERVTAHDVAGCHTCHGSSCCFPLCCCLCLFRCCDDSCFWGCFNIGIPVPCATCHPYICACERAGNGWVLRDRGFKKGELLVVDRENRTYACYGKECCSGQMHEAPPWCYFKRACC